MFGTPIEAQNVSTGMILATTDGGFFRQTSRVFRVAKVVPMNLIGVPEVIVENGKKVGMRMVPTYTHVQLITTRGGVINLSLTDKLVPVV